MTADIEMQSPATDEANSSKKSNRTGRRKSTAGSGAAKRGRKSAAPRRASSAQAGSENDSRKSARSRKGNGTTAKSRKAASAGSNSRRSSDGKNRQGIATRILKSGGRAASSAYGLVSGGASRALPLSVRSLPDQRIVQKLVDERPYMLGALGLGIGAMIGLMLPSPIASIARGASKTGRNGNGSRRRG